MVDVKTQDVPTQSEPSQDTSKTPGLIRKTDITKNPTWQQRQRDIVRMQGRTQKLLQAILGQFPITEDAEPDIPDNTVYWLQKLLSDTDVNDMVELFQCMFHALMSC
jgi:hypothetical protein